MSNSTNIKSFICPNCSTQNNYRLALPISITCKSCNTNFILNTDLSTQNTTNGWENHPIVSVIKLGTTGTYQNKKFEIIGYLRNINSFTISNEWLMYFEDNSTLWLTETNFNYFIYGIQSTLIAYNEIKSKKAGELIKLNGKEFIIQEISKLIKCYTHGEIPLESLNDESFFKYEIKELNSSWYATICIFNKEQIEAYSGIKINLNDLKLSNINEFKDWQ